MGIDETIDKMMELFEEVDRQTDQFSNGTTLHCKAGCGACCTNPHIETTMAEMVPLASHLWKRGHALAKLKEIDQKNDSVCVFYQADPSNPTMGRCGIYAYRPGVCRLFGFTARLNKHGQKELLSCKIIKESQPKTIESIEKNLQRINIPLISTYSFNVASIDPLHGQKLFRINEAVKLALGKIRYFYLWE